MKIHIYYASVWNKKNHVTSCFFSKFTENKPVPHPAEDIVDYQPDPEEETQMIQESQTESTA